jgi:hypothetical protein
MKRVVSQQSRIMIIGMEMDVDCCLNISHGVSYSEISMPKARAWMERCLSSIGKSS